MKYIIGAIVILVAIIAATSIYLAPDDLKTCPKPNTQNGCSKVDAIVAISGGDTMARTNEAIRLYEQGWAAKLVFSGAALDKTGPSNASAMRQAAIKAGVPSDVILIEEQAATTKQNAENVHNMFQINGISSVVLVTSGYHQRRAGLEFNKRANGQVRIVNHPVMSDRQWSSTWWLRPQGWYLAVGELVKIGAFYMGGTR